MAESEFESGSPRHQGVSNISYYHVKEVNQEDPSLVLITQKLQSSVNPGNLAFGCLESSWFQLPFSSSFHLRGTFFPVCTYLPAHSSPLFHCPHLRFLLQAGTHIPTSEIFPGLCSAHRFHSSSQSLLAPDIYRKFPPLSKALRLASFLSHPSPVLFHVGPLVGGQLASHWLSKTGRASLTSRPCSPASGAFLVVPMLLWALSAFGCFPTCRMLSPQILRHSGPPSSESP